MPGSLGDDTRGVGISEGASVATLVVLTVVVTASVGIGVLFIDTGSEEGIDASFAFDYFSSRAALLVTYEDGQELKASNVRISGPTKNITWAKLRQLNQTATIAPGDRAQLNANNAYGSRVTSGNISIVYVTGNNETVLATWTGS